MKLISMTDFVLEVAKEREDYEANYEGSWFYSGHDFDKCMKYANFLKQPLKLEMFVTCDKEGSVLEEPPKQWMEEYKNSLEGDFSDWYTACFNYEQAKEKVLFEGFEINDFKITDKGIMMNSKKWKSVWMIDNRNVEEMVYINAAITFSGLKQLGLD